MNIRHNDINDDEIRIISSCNNTRTTKKRDTLFGWICAIAATLAIVVAAIVYVATGDETSKDALSEPTGQTFEQVSHHKKPFTARTDTVVNGIELSILSPYNATPTLEIGNNVLNDSTTVLLAQAADIRGDNGEIVGAFVVDGELVGKGEAKAGFCAIINGEISLGVADATPMFEQALTSDGCFFRQYPLVVAGQIVENKPKGKALRKALAEIDGKISVIISNNRATFHEFSQALVDIGVSNAIYLIGSDSYGSYKDSDDKTTVFGQKWEDTANVNYIVWR